MKYMLLIHHGETPDFASLPQDEQRAIYAGYQAINETEGVTPGQLGN